MLIPVILSGGLGSRLWPLSRKAKPKHFMPLIESNMLSSDLDDDIENITAKSLLQQTILRCSKHLDYPNNPFSTNPVMVCDTEHRFLVIDQCKELGIKPEEILLEPERKDTAAAILLAVMYIYKKYPKAVVLISPSDHYMSDYNYYLNRVSDAYVHAEQNNIVTFGIKPSYPETRYGYINADLKSNLDKNSYKVKQFIEKPDLEKAKKLIENDNWFWNSGMFMFKAKTFLDLCQELQPELYEYCAETVASARKDHEFISFASNAFSQIDPISIDYALMQDVKNMVVTSYSGQWADVGCWHGVWQNTPNKDASNNVVMGNVLHNDTENCYLRSDGRLIVTLGVNNLTVIETPDAVLVTRLDNSHNLRNIVETSMAYKLKEFVEHSHVHRPWGEFTVLGNGEEYKVKKLTVKPGASLSLQSHEHRSEHWVIVHGLAEIIKDEEVMQVGVNGTVYIPAGTKHRITNHHECENLVIIEVQTGSYLEEDDIIRYQDMYGRVKIPTNNQPTNSKNNKLDSN